MTVNGPQSATRVQTSAPPPPPPPPPQLSPVQQGDVAAGRLRLVEGQLFNVPSAGSPNTAPPTARWGDQPLTSPYRQAFEQVAGRMGTSDHAAITAEIDRQLYGASSTTPAVAAQAAATTTSTSTSAASQEGWGSAFEGALMGNFSDNRSWSATGGQIAVGFVPIVGQIADARDTIASVGQVIRGEDGGWLNLGASIIGWVPGVGDAAKAAIRGGSNLADAGVDVTRTVARNADEVPTTGMVNAVQPGGGAGQGLTFRADSRPWSQIFVDGFQPRGTSNDLFAHALDNANPPSAFVPTSTSYDVARDFAIRGGHDNVYVVRPTNGIDVNATLGARSPFPNELEIAVPQPGIAASDVRAVTLESQGISILNPNWRP